MNYWNFVFGKILPAQLWVLIGVLTATFWLLFSYSDISGIVYQGEYIQVIAVIDRVSNTKFAIGLLTPPEESNTLSSSVEVFSYEYHFKDADKINHIGMSYSTQIFALGSNTKVLYLEKNPNISRLIGGRIKPFSPDMLIVISTMIIVIVTGMIIQTRKELKRYQGKQYDRLSCKGAILSLCVAFFVITANTICIIFMIAKTPK